MKYDVGVLFVHGIGQQPEGDTLVAFGEPFVRWTDRWLHRATDQGATGSFEVVASQLNPSRTGDPFPPHAVCRLVVSENGQPRSSRWLLAESWWGGDVQAPPFGRFSGWMLTIGAWAVIAHMTKRARDYPKGGARLLFEILATTAGLVLSTVMQLVVLLLSVLALVPIPALRRGLSSVLLTLTGVLGDCYVLVQSNLQRAAIVTRTRAALKWLARNCEKVVVIAHSQGAAVAHYTLSSPTPENIELLVTLGSGLGKLDELEHSGKSEARVHSVARMAPVAVLVFGLLMYLTLFEGSDELSRLARYFVGFLAFVCFLWVFLVARKHWEHVDERARDLSLSQVRAGLRWVDIFASSDPVPNGAMLPGGIPIAGVTPVRVVNLSSILGDHTAYWQNRCEFIPRVVREVSGKLGLGLFTEAEEKALDALAQRHQRNVRWLKLSTGAALLGVAALFLLYRDELAERGQFIVSHLNAKGTPFESFWERVQGAVMFVLRWVAQDNAATVGFQLIGAAIPVALIAGWHGAYRFLWRWWDGVALDEVLRPGRVQRADRVVRTVTVIALGLAPLAVVVAWPWLKGIMIGHLIASAWIGLYVLLMIIGAIQVGRKLLRWRVVVAGGDRAARAKIKEELMGLAAMVLFTAFLLWIALPQFKSTHEIGIGLIVIAINVYLLWKLQIWFIQRVRLLIDRSLARWTVWVSPGLMAISLTTYLVTEAVDTSGGREAELIHPLQTIGLQVGLLYAIALLLAAGVVKLIGRPRVPAARSPG